MAEESKEKPVEEKDFARRLQSLQAKLVNAKHLVDVTRAAVEDAWMQYEQTEDCYDDAVVKRDALQSELDYLTHHRPDVEDVKDFVVEMKHIFDKGYQSFTEEQFNKLHNLVKVNQTEPGSADRGYQHADDSRPESSGDVREPMDQDLQGAEPMGQGRGRHARRRSPPRERSQGSGDRHHSRHRSASRSPPPR